MSTKEARSVLRSALALAVLPCLMQSGKAQPQYTITNLGSLGGGISSWAADINNSGQVAGYSRMESGQLFRIFRTAPNSPINPATDDVTPSNSGYYSATGINDSGQIVGRYMFLSLF